MKLTSIQAKIITALISLLLISIAVYYLQTKDSELPPMTVQEKKARFKKLIVPAVNNVYADLIKQYNEVSSSIESGSGEEKIAKLKVEYKASSNETLLMALKPHPKSIAIAQAAMESNWATSRFFIKAYNIFGCVVF